MVDEALETWGRTKYLEDDTCNICYEKGLSTLTSMQHI